MLYKEIVCPKCNGYGFISHYEENGVWSECCTECHNGIIVVPMTNGDIIRRCNNEQLIKVFSSLKNRSINLLLWLNKETDKCDLETTFDFINEKDYEHPYLTVAQIKT